MKHVSRDTRHADPKHRWNNTTRIRDYYYVDCDVAREALSARIDGEREAVPTLRVDEHLTSCASCRDWYARAVEQTQQLRRLVGRSQVSAVPTWQAGTPARSRFRAWTTATWQRWALGALGVIQIGLAAAQGLGADVGTPALGHNAVSIAWAAALGVAMIAAALRPAAASALAAVVLVSSLVAAGFLIGVAGALTVARVVSHLPMLAGTALALLVWRAARPDRPAPKSGADPAADDIVLPENATRGRRRGHLHPTDGSSGLSA